MYDLIETFQKGLPVARIGYVPRRRGRGGGLLFGPELRRRREAAGMSLAGLAASVHYDKGYLSRVERGLRGATSQLAMRCDEILSTGGALSALVPRQVGLEWTEPAPASGDVRSPGVRSAPTAVTDGAADALTQLFDQLRRLGQQTDARLVLPQVAALAETLASTADSPRPGAPVLRLAALCSEYAGWMAQETGDPGLALRWTRHAVDLSTRVGDGDMKAYALVRQADLALDHGDAAQVVQLAEAAAGHPHAGPRVRALAAYCQAQGHALAGDRRACEQALSIADELCAAAAGERPGALPPLGPWAAGNLGPMIAGLCYQDLGLNTRAAELLEPVLAAAPPWAVRARGRIGTRLALARIGLGDINGACAAGREAAAAVRDTGSATNRTALARFARALTRWRTRTDTRELRIELATVLHGEQ